MKWLNPLTQLEDIDQDEQPKDMLYTTLDPHWDAFYGPILKVQDPVNILEESNTAYPVKACHLSW